MMRRILIALTALMLIGGVASSATARPDSASVERAAGDNPNPPDQEPGCNPSGQTPKKCCKNSEGSNIHGLDTDDDGVCDDDDNCPSTANPDQADSDDNGVGDACEPDACADNGGDTDGDGVCDNNDNCADVANPDQADTDGDGLGDACDPPDPGPCDDNGGDADGDGVCGNVDNCADVANADQADTDGDGIGDACDPPEPPVNKCTAGTHDPGILTDDTLGQTLWDGGLQLSPLTEDPEADGPISGAIYGFGNGTPLEPVTDEASCLVDLLFDGAALGADL